MKTLSQQAVLHEVFNRVYGITFDPKEMDHRVMMQKAVFLMRETGVSLGDYNFVWDHYGPFSAFLSDDMKRDIGNVDEHLEYTFSDRAQKVLASLNELMNYNDIEYKPREWSEAVASLYYIKKYIHPDYTDKQVVEDLESRKGYLCKHSDNEKAMELLSKLTVELG